VSSRASVWWDALSGDEHAALHRRPTSLRRTADVVVIGGGILGAVTAWSCRQAGLGRVVLIEADCLGSGATGGAAGLLVPDAHHGTHPEHFVELGRRSLKLWREFHRAVPDGVGLVDIDWLGLEPPPPGWFAPPEARHLGADEVSRLVPGLATPAAGILVRQQAWVNPLRALARISTGIDTVATDTTVTRVEVQAGGGVEISTDAGPLSAGSVVFATGGPPKLPGLSVELPSTRVRGHLLVTAPTAEQMPGCVAPVATRLPDGRLLVGGTEDTDDADEVDAGIVAGLRQRLDAVLPGAAPFASTHAWCCFRPAHPDHLPVIDRIQGHNAWFTSGHYRTGILMAPATAHAVATWIESGRRPDHISELGASRFETTAVHEPADHVVEGPPGKSQTERFRTP
jgi:glycine oxidase